MRDQDIAWAFIGGLDVISEVKRLDVINE